MTTYQTPRLIEAAYLLANGAKLVSTHTDGLITWFTFIHADRLATQYTAEEKALVKFVMKYLDLRTLASKTARAIKES